MNTSYDKQTLAQAIDRLSDAKKPQRDDLASTSDSASVSWDLNTGFNLARQLASEGWEEKSADLWKQVHALAVRVEVGVQEVYDVSGGSVDIGRFMSGEPECMMTQTLTPLSAVSVLMNICASASADAEHLYNRGIAVAAVIHALQSSGRGVSLRVCESVWSWGSRHITEITLQEFGEYIHSGRLAFWTAHPAALRRCIFRYNEQQSDEIRREHGFRSGYGYGRPEDLGADEIPKGTVYIPFPTTSMLHREYSDPASALKAVVAEFQKRGVPIEVDIPER
jgi:hypothetical protein